MADAYGGHRERPANRLIIEQADGFVFLFQCERIEQREIMLGGGDGESSGLPGAGYCTSKSARGKPPKSWMVRGFSIAVTKVPFVSQCAEMQRIALGRGIVSAIFRKPVTKSFSSMAFIGLPWPANRTGIGEVVSKERVIF